MRGDFADKDGEHRLLKPAEGLMVRKRWRWDAHPDLKLCLSFSAPIPGAHVMPSEAAL